MLVLTFMSIFIYIVAILTFIVINTLWIPLVALGLFIFFGLAGSIPTNIYYFGELGEKSKKDTITYLCSYIPLLVGITIVVFS